MLLSVNCERVLQDLLGMVSDHSVGRIVFSEAQTNG